METTREKCYLPWNLLKLLKMSSTTIKESLEKIHTKCYAGKEGHYIMVSEPRLGHLDI